MGVSARSEYILLTSLVFVLLAALITGLTLGLKTPPLPNGGSPVDPARPNGTTTATTSKQTTASTTVGVPSSTTTTTRLPPSTQTTTSVPPSTKTTTGAAPFVTKAPAKVSADLGYSVKQRKPHLKRNVGCKPRSKSEGYWYCPEAVGDNGVQETGRVDEMPPWPPSVTKRFKRAAVTTDTIPCSSIGVDVLRVGGSAVDAAIAAAICVGVVNIHSCGIGGGHFMTIYERPRNDTRMEIRTIQAREWAPLAATEDMFVNNTEASSKGGLSIAVPGEVKGYYTAWQRYGRLPWSELFQPSIQLCHEGFIVERSLSDAIESYEEDIRSDPNLSELFVKEDGSLVTEGDLLKNPKLGVTLSRIAEDPDEYYFGSLADDIVADLAENGSIITKEDLLGYRAKLKYPVTVNLSNGNLTAHSVTPPSSGVIYHYILNILNGYYFEPSMLDDVDSQVLTYHRIIEAFKFAYAKRSYLGDEDFVDVEDLLVNLTSPDYGEYIRSRINDNTTQNYTYYEPNFDAPVDGGTAHLSVLAEDGAAVAMTMTINLYFGSNVRGNRTGIMFNDEMDDFSTPGTENSFGVPASPANYIVPGKMPMSSMCPTLMFDNNNNNNTVVFAAGAAGGTRITTGTAFVTMHALWFNQTLENATDTARLHNQLAPDDVKYEPHMSQDIVTGLEQKNHVVTLYGNIAVVNSIHVNCAQGDNCIYAVSDGRKGGAPDGI